MGSSNCDTDIKVSLNNGDKKCLQIKTLSNRNCPNTEVYRACNLLYRRNILIVMANEKRNKFCLGFSEQFKCSDVWFDFDKMNYPNLMYDNIDIFTKKLVQLVQESVNFDIIIASATVKIELECMERLKLWCEKNSLSFKRCDNHASSIDCYINNISVQVKCRKGDSRSNIHTKNFNVRINKGAGKKINRIRQPYEPGDFEMLIVEINEPIYHNKFFFISQYDLFEYGFLRSELTYGKENMLVSNPNYKIGNWSDIFWDETITINRIKKFEEYKQGKVMEYLEDGYLYPGVDPLEYLSEDSKIDDIQRVNIKNIIKMNTDRNKTQSDILTNIHFVESKTEKILKNLDEKDKDKILKNLDEKDKTILPFSSENSDLSCLVFYPIPDLIPIPEVKLSPSPLPLPLPLPLPSTTSLPSLPTSLPPSLPSIISLSTEL